MGKMHYSQSSKVISVTGTWAARTEQHDDKNSKRGEKTKTRATKFQKLLTTKREIR